MNKKLNDQIEKKLKDLKIKENFKQSGYNLGLKLSMDLVSAIIAGILIGLGLDNFFSTKPIFFLIFLLLGIIAGFYSLYKSAQNLNKKD